MIKMKDELTSLVFVSCVQVLRGLAYLRDKHQIMHRGKAGWCLVALNFIAFQPRPAASRRHCERDGCTIS